MKFSKAYIFLKTKVGMEEDVIKRIKALNLKYHGLYRLFGTYDLAIELLYKDWQELDDFMHPLQVDDTLKGCIEEELRLISHDKTAVIEN